jgi:hypothetical protein
MYHTLGNKNCVYQCYTPISIMFYQLPSIRPIFILQLTWLNNFRAVDVVSVCNKSVLHSCVTIQ